MTPEEKKELFSKLSECKTEIAGLRRRLNEVDQQKEDHFEKKEKHGNEIKSLINNIKGNKELRDKLTNQVKEDKESRKKFNLEIRNKISKIKETKKKKEDLAKKSKVEGNPLRLIEDIKRLESKIETEIMSFDKEKEIMKTIKSFKKKLKLSGKVIEINEEIHKISKDIDKSRANAEETHKNVQNKAKESQQKHEGIISTSKEIDELRIKEKTEFEKFLKSKKEFNEVNDKLKERLIGLSRINEKVSKYQLDDKNKKEELTKQLLKSKEDFVNEKIKKGEKLTNEDLLIFQTLKK
ncbi:MAG: hypothetical protein QF824_04360 [Candidatus Woesearchaeota archaeon]|jgi:uncharacterized coiled-coil DUF342 family protein|nr:hypothetical protein [Candidatus Woesearchaeota archaeon]